MAGKYNVFSQGGFSTPVEPAVPSTRVHLCYEEIGAEGAVALRFTIVSRQGHRWSYPYHSLGLTELPSSEILVLHGNCGTVKTITFQGRGLDAVAHLLDLHRLTLIRQADNPAFSQDVTCVASIDISIT